MTTLDMQLIVELVKKQGHPAYVEQTGGGCATIYAGKEVLGDDGDPYYPVMAGPGWFHGGGWTIPQASTEEFYIGPGPDMTTPLASLPADGDEQLAATMIVDLLGGPNLPYTTDGGHVTVRLPKEDD